MYAIRPLDVLQSHVLTASGLLHRPEFEAAPNPAPLATQPVISRCRPGAFADWLKVALNMQCDANGGQRYRSRPGNEKSRDALLPTYK